MLTKFESTDNIDLDLDKRFRFDPSAVILTDTLGISHEKGCELVEKELFTQVPIKSLNAHESKNWIYINKIYIPKSFISHIYVYQNSLYGFSMRLYMINSKYTVLSYLPIHEEYFKSIAPNIFVVKKDVLESKDNKVNEKFLTLLDHNENNIVNAIYERPSFFDNFIKETLNR
ncbi:MAG: hypothetical protein ACRDCW_08900 [Sarcina sp.]